MLTLLNLLPRWLRSRLFVVYSLTRRAMTLGVRCIIQNDEGYVLLVRHTYVSGWHLPGGGVERGETVQDAAIKELYEEANLTLNEPPQLIHFYRNPRSSKFDHVALFDCKSWSGDLRTEPDFEIAEICFFPLDALPEGTTEPTRTRLKEVFENQPMSDVW